MNATREVEEWILSEIADLALSDPVRALAMIAPPVRYLDAAYMHLAGDLLEQAAHDLRDGTLDLRAFSRVVDDAAREVRLSRRTVEALRTGAALPGSRRIRRRPSRQSLGRFTRLRQVGARFVGRCPLHEDSTPSFVCYQDGRFFCYGCLQWGDAVDLVSRLEQLPVREAAALLDREFACTDSTLAVLRQGKTTPLPRPAGVQAVVASHDAR